MEKTLGEVGYEAYRADTGGISLVSKQPIPDWVDLSGDIQHAWEAAGSAVENEILRRQGDAHAG